MSATRTDIHRAASADFDPESYEFYDCFDFGMTPEAAHSQQDYERVITGLKARGFTAFHGGGGCAHCGAHIRYVGLLVHNANREYLLVGETCLSTTFANTKAAFAALRASNKRSAKARIEREKFAKLIERLTADPATARRGQALAYATYAHNIGVAGIGDLSASLPELPETFGVKTRQGWAISTLDDLATKAQRYGEPTEKQWALIEKLHVQLDEAATKLVEREAVQAETPDLVEGRRELVGTVRSVKPVDNDYTGGVTWKMTVDLPDGTRVYGTCPRSLPDVIEGKTVRFTATVTRSPKDRTFGWYSRPVKAELA